MGNMVPFEYLLGETFVLLGLIGFVIFSWQDNRIYNPEGRSFKIGRKQGRPVFSTEDPGTGNAIFQLGHKDDDNDPTIEMDYGGIQIEPGFLSADAPPTRYPGGLTIYHNASTKSVPLPTRAALAYKTFKKHRRDKGIYKQLDFLSDNELTAILNSPRNHLDHNAGLFLAKYKPLDDIGQPMSTEYMVEIVKSMQDYLATLPVEEGWFCYHEMFKAIPFSHSAQDTERMKSIQEQKGWLKYMKNLDLMKYVIMGIMAMMGGAVAIYIVSAAV